MADAQKVCEQAAQIAALKEALDMAIKRFEAIVEAIEDSDDLEALRRAQK